MCYVMLMWIDMWIYVLLNDVFYVFKFKWLIIIVWENV